MIRIITEAMSDLTRMDAMNLGVTLVSQPLRFGMEEFLDDGGVSLKREDFFARMRVATELPHTSMVPMAFWLDASTSACAIRQRRSSASPVPRSFPAAITRRSWLRKSAPILPA